jgi:Short-chain dehydrogenases of various substrate specificities
MSKTALVTGTTSGIGYDICTLFAEDKVNLVLVSRSQEKLLNQKKELQNKYGIQIDIIAHDLAEPNSAEQIISHLISKNIHIDYLVNNAGFNEVGAFSNTDLTNELEMIQLHITFVTKLTKYILPTMLKNSHGRILNIVSTGAYIPCPHDIVYTATKAYLLSFTKGLSAELRQTGITVTAACPGATHSNFALKAGIDKSLLFKFFVMDSAYVAQKSYKAFMSGKKVEIVGLYNRILVFSSYILPSQLVSWVGLKMLK